jgi:DNA-directed RNA polymerase specialized sigma subunit
MTSINNERISEAYGLIEKIVRSKKLKIPTLDEEDLTSYLGEKLISILDKFDPDKGAWINYASRSLKFYVYNWIRDNYKDIQVPRTIIDLFRKQEAYLDAHPELLALEVNERFGLVSSALGVTKRQLTNAQQGYHSRFTQDIEIINEAELDQDSEDSENYYHVVYRNLDRKSQKLLKDYYKNPNEASPEVLQLVHDMEQRVQQLINIG